MGIVGIRDDVDRQGQNTWRQQKDVDSVSSKFKEGSLPRARLVGWRVGD